MSNRYRGKIVGELLPRAFKAVPGESRSLFLASLAVAIGVTDKETVPTETYDAINGYFNRINLRGSKEQRKDLPERTQFLIDELLGARRRLNCLSNVAIEQCAQPSNCTNDLSDFFTKRAKVLRSIFNSSGVVLLTPFPRNLEEIDENKLAERGRGRFGNIPLYGAVTALDTRVNVDGIGMADYAVTFPVEHEGGLTTRVGSQVFDKIFMAPNIHGQENIAYLVRPDVEPDWSFPSR